MFFFVEVTAADGEYTRAFKDEVSSYRNCRNLLCDPVNEGGKWYDTTYTSSVEVGHSYGPGGTTTHYENRQIPIRRRGSESWKCRKCQRSFHDQSISGPSVYAPTVRISKDGDTEVMSVNSWFSSPPCSALPKDNGDNHLKLLRKIKERSRCRYTNNNWEHLLSSMWESARNLDSPEGITKNIFSTEGHPGGPFFFSEESSGSESSSDFSARIPVKGPVYKVQGSCVIQ